jgi:hypothetical protein
LPASFFCFSDLILTLSEETDAVRVGGSRVELQHAGVGASEEKGYGTDMAACALSSLMDEATDEKVKLACKDVNGPSKTIPDEGPEKDEPADYSETGSPSPTIQSRLSQSLPWARAKFRGAAWLAVKLLKRAGLAPWPLMV